MRQMLHDVLTAFGLVAAMVLATLTFLQGGYWYAASFGFVFVATANVLTLVYRIEERVKPPFVFRDFTGSIDPDPHDGPYV